LPSGYTVSLEEKIIMEPMECTFVGFDVERKEYGVVCTSKRSFLKTINCKGSYMPKTYNNQKGAEDHKVNQRQP
jgi:hypothetical protein